MTGASPIIEKLSRFQSSYFPGYKMGDAETADAPVAEPPVEVEPEVPVEPEDQADGNS